MQVTVTGTHTVTPLVDTPAAERNGIVSPDGRWLAYERTTRGHSRSMCGRIPTGERPLAGLDRRWDAAPLVARRARVVLRVVGQWSDARRR
jgi:hypothetical protein